MRSWKDIRIHWLMLVGLVCPANSKPAPADEPAVGERQILFMIGEPEYRTDETLPEFFRSELAGAGYRAAFIIAPRDGEAQHDFVGLEAALPEADLLVLSVRRRAPKAGQLEAVRRHLMSGKPLVAIRTSSHAFDARVNSPPGHAQWRDFDEQVLGGKYSGHYGEEPVRLRLGDGAAEDPLLQGVTLWESAKLYRSQLRSPAARLLLSGQRPNGQQEPVAWTHRFGPRAARVFYTSLGVESDFRRPGFRRLLHNAIDWALEGDPRVEE